MNYLKIYNQLIDRSRDRKLDIYFERHHIIPRCLGGSNDSNNIVNLTPEEHYVAHQLLCKIYPMNRKLIHAACMMTVSNRYVVRNNKLYGWLRRQLSDSAKLRTRTTNGSTGKPWYHNPVDNSSGKFIPGSEPAGWMLGRVPKSIYRCSICGTVIAGQTRKYCSLCKPKKKKTIFRVQKIKDAFTDEEKLEAIKNTKNIRQALFSLGLNDSGENYQMMKKLYATVYPHATNV